jgi:hypothetical protein
MDSKEIINAASLLSDAIARGIAMMLWDKHGISLTPAAELDVGTLVVMNAVEIHAIVEHAGRLPANAQGVTRDQ